MHLTILKANAVGLICAVEVLVVYSIWINIRLTGPLTLHIRVKRSFLGKKYCIFQYKRHFFNPISHVKICLDPIHTKGMNKNNKINFFSKGIQNGKISKINFMHYLQISGGKGLSFLIKIFLKQNGFHEIIVWKILLVIHCGIISS